ncbi:uncharacterized protein J4E87_003424 [Alternaria ethzedia]|uniref:uncharacterized protein n=1 Tax=Alternaria ethzedia TaxID=181014 RepID=UPI0020C1BEEA|nr:uncharacterized protein J4E87_003424 [Alternaria ethzedia]KAI4629163.1 hypothetical protein J4E87_003424 [Alternaria ethzedia]
MPPPNKPTLPLHKDKAAPPLHSAAARSGSEANAIIEVGPDRMKYHVQKAFLVHHSDYFHKALSGTWKEAEDGVVTLVDVEPAIFNLFVEWLYTQQLPSSRSDYRRVADANFSEDVCKIRLYVFADRFAVPALRTAMNRQIVGERDVTSGLCWGVTQIAYAFDNLPTSDPVLDFLVDQYYTEWGGHSTFAEGLPQEFLLRFFRRVGSERAQGRDVVAESFRVDFCTYHEHATDADKSSCSHKPRLGGGHFVGLERPVRSETRSRSIVGSKRPATSSS